VQEPDDPIIVPIEMARDARIALATWRRRWRHHPEVEKALIWLSPRRCGMRQSRWRSILAGGVRRKDGGQP
jgi:hypothetical protein